MPRPAITSATSVHALEAAAPTPAKAAIGDMGQAGGKDSLARLNAAVADLRAMAVQPLVNQAIHALQKENFVDGGKWAIKALEQDEHCGPAWYLLGIARERAGDFTNSVQAYEMALRLLPNHGDVANDLGRLAYRMGMLEQAEKLFAHYMAVAPDNPEGPNNVASAMRDRGRTEEAIELLKSSIMAHPDCAMLWNTLATIMIEEGDIENAEIFFGESMRLAPTFGKARYNLSQCKLALGDAQGALEDCDAAMKLTVTADDREMMRLARSSYLLALGRIAEGWDDYEARLSPQFADVTHFLVDRPKWTPGADVKGKTVLVIGEQGLGDEVLFGNVLPDLQERIGPEGQLRIAVERRLVSLFQRSFPDAEVTPHGTGLVATQPVRAAPKTDLAGVDLWTPIASLLREYRTSLADFPDRVGYLKADPERVAHWQAQLQGAPAGPKVGLLWKSAIDKGHRRRFFSPFDKWAPVLKTPGVTFVNLQYGDCSAELEQAERELGVTIWQPPGIDLKADLDDVTALCCAMDLVVGFSNATLNLGAAAGAPTWLISMPAAWTRLGTADRYPWYPQVRVFEPQGLSAWGPLMDEVAGALGEFAAKD